MKNIFRNNRLTSIALVVILSTFVAPVVKANDSNYVIPVQLKFIGTLHNHPLFQISFYGNTTENHFSITIKDQFGNSLYSENFKGENITKKFLLNTDEIGDDTIRFEITSRKPNKTVVYEINHNSRQVEEMVITKL